MNTKKKIAFFGIKYYPSRGGTSRVAEALIRELRNDFDITIYCYSSIEAETHLEGVKTVMFPVPKLKDLGVFLFFCKCFLHLFFKGKYDLVHIHKTEAAVFAPLIGFRFPVVATAHELPYLREKWTWLGRTYLRLAEHIFIHSSATLTTISQSDAAYYQQKYHKAVRFIPNGIMKSELASPDEFDQFLRNHSIRPGTEYLFFAARRMMPSKGCHHLLKAMKSIGYRGKLIVAGDLDQMPLYTRSLLDESKDLDVNYLGFVSSSKMINCLIKNAKLFVFPSELEGMSMMLLEAVILGTGVLASDIPQNTLIFDSEHIVFFKSKDQRDLGAKLLWMLENPRQVQEMSEKARRHAEMHYSLSQIALQYKQLYLEH